jgi:hypothetical protein
MVVGAPDHPFLLRPPDIITGGVQGLCAILIPTAEEELSPKNFEARLALCYGALPSPTAFVVVATRSSAHNFARFQADRAAVLADPKQGEVVAIASRPGRISPKDIPPDLQQRISDRFATIYRLSRATFFSKRTGILSSAANIPDATIKSRRLQFVETYGDVDVSIFPREPTPRDIKNITFDGAQKTYHLDNGVPYLGGRPADIAVTDEQPTVRGDPDKYLRAAAFSGWLIAGPSALDRMPNLALRVSETTR